MTEPTEPQLRAEIAARERQIAAQQRATLQAFRDAIVTPELLAALSAGAALLPTLSGGGSVAAYSFVTHAQGFPGLLDAEIARLSSASTPPPTMPDPMPPM